MTRLAFVILVAGVVGCDNSAGLAEMECLTVREFGTQGRCFVLCDNNGTGDTIVRAVGCPAQPTAGGTP